MEKKNVNRVLMFFVICLITIKLNAQEDKFKALFIYNFTKYIEWTSSTSQDFTIAIIGDGPIKKELENVAAKMKVGTKPIVVKAYKSVEEITKANIIYVADRSADIKSIAEKAKTVGSLVVCNTPLGCQKGSGINFISKNGNLAFEISSKNIIACGLKVNSSLLALGTSVD